MYLVSLKLLESKNIPTVQVASVHTYWDRTTELSVGMSHASLSSVKFTCTEDHHSGRMWAFEPEEVLRPDPDTGSIFLNDDTDSELE